MSLLVWSAPVLACAAPAERASYRIEHETFGNIGRQVLTFRCNGDQLVVDTTVNVAVRMLFFTIYRHEAHYRGIWQGDRLIRFESHTNDNGRILEVLARAAGERVIIDGPKGRSEAPLAVMPNHPWNLATIDRTVLFDTIDGRPFRWMWPRPARNRSWSMGAGLWRRSILSPATSTGVVVR